MDNECRGSTCTCQTLVIVMRFLHLYNNNAGAKVHSEWSTSGGVLATGVLFRMYAIQNVAGMVHRNNNQSSWPGMCI